MPSKTLPPRYLGIAAIIYAVVSAYWLVLEVFFGTPGQRIVTILGGVVILVLIALAIVFITRTPRPPPATEGDRTGMWFGIIFAWEGIGIGVASGVLAALGQTQWIGVAVAIIVGLHFFPLGWLFNLRMDYAIGGLIVLLAIVVPVLVADEQARFTVIAYGCAVILYAAGWGRLLLGRSVLRTV
jgi:hypothetical protein